MRYNSDLFEVATIARIAKHFDTLLHHVTTHPRTTLDALSGVLSTSDRQQLTAALQQYKKAGRERLKAARRVATHIFEHHTDNANSYVTHRGLGDPSHPGLNGSSAASKH